MTQSEEKLESGEESLDGSPPFPICDLRKKTEAMERRGQNYSWVIGRRGSPALGGRV